MATTNHTLDPFAPPTTTLNIITWEISDVIEGASPAREVVEIWTKIFNRGPFQPTSEEACVFTVTDRDGRSVQIDLSDEKYAHLFAS